MEHQGGDLFVWNPFIDLKIQYLSPLIGRSVPVPAYATDGSAGIDIAACIEQPVVLNPGDTVKIPTGLAIQLPSEHYVALLLPRSGISTKHGITMPNSAGVIDSDYRGEIFCVLHNESQHSFTIETGVRIAQLVIVPVVRARLAVVSRLDDTSRGSGGFGSTGM
jgi:dUTP pyrophosphatase